MAKKVTGFEAVPQGQIGSGFAQVFDTSNLVQAAVQMREFKRQQFDSLISSLADIDPKLAHPKDTEDIVYGVNQLYDFVVENYQSIADPRKDPSKAIEFKRRKNELLAGVHQSQKMGELALKHSEEMAKNDYLMGAYRQNASLIERLNSEKVFTRNEDGSLVRNDGVSRLFSERLSIGKSANDMATELAEKTKAQFDPENPDLQQIRLSNGTFVSLYPNKVTDEQANQIIDNSLMGGGVDGVAVVNSVLGFEAPYDMLTEAEKQTVRDAIRPSFLNRLDTTPKTSVVRDPSNFGDQKREFDMDTRLRSLRELVTGENSGILSDQNWGDTGAVVRSTSRSFNDGGELVYTVVLDKNGQISEREYVLGKRNEDGRVLLGDEAGERFETGLTSFLSAANKSLNASQAGDVKTPDIEKINEPFIKQLREEINQGSFEVLVGQGDVYKLNNTPATKKEVVASVDEVISADATKNTKSTFTLVNDLSRWAQSQGYQSGSVELEASSSTGGKVTMKVGNSVTEYNLKDPQQRDAFIEVYVSNLAVPSGAETTQERVKVGSAKGAVNPFAKQ